MVNSLDSMITWAKVIGVLMITLLALNYCQSLELKEKQKEQDKQLQQLLEQQRYSSQPVIEQPIQNDPDLPYSGGSNDETCASQGHRICNRNDYCTSDAWIRSSDTSTCCTTECVSRIYDSYIDPTIGGVVIEKTSSGFLVWYGNSIDFAEFGSSNVVEAIPLEGTQWQFTVPSGYKGQFEVTRNENSIIEVKRR